MKRNNSTSKKKMLDQIDCRMIELLQKDGRISNTDIAKEIGLSEATVRTRLNRLIQEEYIRLHLLFAWCSQPLPIMISVF